MKVKPMASFTARTEAGSAAGRSFVTRSSPTKRFSSARSGAEGGGRGHQHSSVARLQPLGPELLRAPGGSVRAMGEVEVEVWVWGKHRSAP